MFNRCNLVVDLASCRDLHTFCDIIVWLLMMLFADSVTMPSLKLNNKRKIQHSNGDHLPSPSKKAALDHAEIPHMGTDSPEPMTALLTSREKTKSLILPNGVHVTKIPGATFSHTSSVLGKRKASRDAEVALRLHYCDFGAVPLTKTSKSGRYEYENGHTSSANGSSGDLLCTTGGSHINTVTQQQQQQKDTIKCLLRSTEDVDKVSPQRPAMSSKPLSEVKTENKVGVACQSLKQPSLVLTDYKRNGRNNDLVGGVVSTGSYIRRMASLNASACVAALMEPEKKYSTKAIRHPEISTKAVAGKFLPNWPIDSKHDRGLLFANYSNMQKRSQSPCSCSSASSSEAESSYYSSSDLDITEPHVFRTLLQMVTLNDESHSDDDALYNCYGLLYNGDTMFPSARVFYASDTDLSLPHRIIPRVLPSREMYARAAASQVHKLKVVGKKKKAAKVRFVP